MWPMTKQSSTLLSSQPFPQRTSFLEKKKKKNQRDRNGICKFYFPSCASYIINIYRSISRSREEAINRREREREKKLDELVKAISKARKEWFIDEGLAMYRVKSAPLICLSGCKWLSSWCVNEERQFTVIKRLWYDSR